MVSSSSGVLPSLVTGVSLAAGAMASTSHLVRWGSARRFTLPDDRRGTSLGDMRTKCEGTMYAGIWARIACTTAMMSSGVGSRDRR